MHLSSLSISNILSFPYQDLHSNDNPKSRIIFNQSENPVHIFIGPNGSGKSNLLEIINQMIKCGFFRNFDLEYKNNVPFVKEIKNTFSNLIPHLSSPGKPSTIHTQLKLFTHDRDNIHFVSKFSQRLNSIIQKYSNLSFRFPHFEFEDIDQSIFQEITLLMNVNYNSKEIELIRSGEENKELKIIYDYIEHFELIQKCMFIYNFYDKSAEERLRYELKNTFAIIGPYRQFAHLQGFASREVDATDRENRLLMENTKNQSIAPVGFEYLKRKIANQIRENGNSSILDEINDICKKNLKTTIQFGVEERKIHFYLSRKPGEKLAFDQLSSGEKSVLVIISTIFGYDLENGLLVIDEPELHLHPQLQKDLMFFITQICELKKIQCVIATHSPLMINEHTIENVYRCTWNQDHTEIFAPKIRIHKDEADLIQMLRYSYSAKIFFSKRIILVEGDTDEYFFNALLEYYKETLTWKEKIQDYEIININGKGSYHKRSRFLNRYGIHTSYIGDRDNIQQEILLPRDTLFAKCKEYLIQTQGKESFIKIPKTQRYKKLIGLIHELFPQEGQQIDKKIAELWSKKMYILPLGDLESYLGLRFKGLEHVVYFCRHDMKKRLENPNFEDQRKQREEIFYNIFHS